LLGLVAYFIIYQGLQGHSVVGVYQAKWPGYQQENTKTFDLRADGTCLYSPHTAYAGGVSSFSGAIVVHKDDDSRYAKWTLENGTVTVIFDDSGNSALFKQE